MRRLLVNDMLSALPEHRTFWHSLQDWFGMEFVGGDFSRLAEVAGTACLAAAVDFNPVALIVRNASYFGPIQTNTHQIALLQDIFPEGHREQQEAVLRTCKAVVFNSAFTRAAYCTPEFIERAGKWAPVIPLPVDFKTFSIGNRMGLQQHFGLPDRCVIWVGACDGAAGEVKGWDTFLAIARTNPHISFVAVFKDRLPETVPPNMRTFLRLPQEELAMLMGACRVGLCTSKIETQHLAGIEMGACGLPVVAPPVGVYWGQERKGVALVTEPVPYRFSLAIAEALSVPHDANAIREAWMAEFHPEIVRAKWAALISEVEGA